MKKEMSIKKIVGFCIVMLCMMYALFFYVKDTEATDNTIKYEPGYEYTTSKYNVDGVKTAPEAPSGTSGYLFAGWYTSSDDGTTYEPVAEPQDGTTYYAKFVPQEVLGLKAQVTTALIADEAITKTDNSAIRFVTTVDSDQYKEVGFNITRPGKDTSYDTGNGVYYDTLYAVDATRDNKGDADTTYTPSMFHQESTYFKTWTIKKIPDTYYDSDFTVTPYWITLDGTRVEGTTGTKTVNLGRSWIYVKSGSTSDDELGTLNAPYKTMAKAVAHDTTLPLKVTLKSDVTVSGTINIDAGDNITIVDDKTERHIKRDTTTFNTASAGLLFAVKPEASLTFDSTGTDTKPLLIVDGSRDSYESISANWAMVQSQGTLNVNAGVKFTNNATGKNGGAINVTGGNLTVNGGTFGDEDASKALSGNNGGAINIAELASGAIATINNATFKGNTSATNGGAINIAANTEVTIGECTFDSNKTTGTGSGGAISNSGTLTLTSSSPEKAVFYKNEATGGAGGAIYSATGTLSVTGYKFQKNKAKNGGAINVSKNTTRADITNCVFYDNEATQAGYALSINTPNGTTCTLSAPSGSEVSDVFTGYTADASSKVTAIFLNGTLHVSGFTLSDADWYNNDGTSSVEYEEAVQQ